MFNAVRTGLTDVNFIIDFQLFIKYSQKKPPNLHLNYFFVSHIWNLLRTSLTKVLNFH